MEGDEIMTKAFRLIVGLAIYLQLSLVNAAIEWPSSDADFARLPAYCKARKAGGKSQIYAVWAKRLGKGFLHVHHYCAAMHLINRSYMINNQKEREQYIGSAIGEIMYVEKHAGHEFVLMPEILVKKGKLLRRLGRDLEAEREFHTAVQLNRKYAPAYMTLSDFYRDKGDIREARKIVEEGLKQAPRSKGLNRRLKELEKTNVK